MVDGGSYITIGDLYKGNKIILPDRWKGKGLSVSELQCNTAVCLPYYSTAVVNTSAIFARTASTSTPYSSSMAVTRIHEAQTSRAYYVLLLYADSACGLS